MITENIHKKAGWYASYMSPQGKALIECQSKKIKQLTDLIEILKGEVELCDDPKEYDEKIVLASVKALITNIPEVEHKEEYFKWIG